MGNDDVIAVWFRKGLRVHDNVTLINAAKDAKKHVIPFFIEEDPFPRGVNRRNFELETLADLDKSLKDKFKSKLLYFTKGGGDAKLTDMVLTTLSKKCGVTAVYYEKDFDPVNRERDAVAAKAAKRLNIRLQGFTGQTILDVQKVISEPGFAPPQSMKQITNIFVKEFGKDFVNNVPNPLPVPKSIPSLPAAAKSLGGTIPKPTKSKSGKREQYFPGGETEAFKRLKRRVEKEIKFICTFEKPQTKSTNDPKDSFEPHTTGLGPYITQGCLSIRTFWHAINDCLKKAKSVGVNSPSIPPMSLHGQLLFREQFYILGLAIPNFDSNKNNAMCKDIKWSPKNEKFMKAWETGQTGYPFIDALMRQLNQTGFVHHLGRHACACFLTRGDLYQSWLHGRDVFDKLLLDADWSLNNANWLWLSGTAPFSSPYFRVYNPSPDKKSSLNADCSTGHFIKTFVPELKDMPVKYMHEPWKAPAAVQEAAKCIIGKDYPKPIVDHKKSRENNIKAFGESLSEITRAAKGASAAKSSTPAKKRSASAASAKKGGSPKKRAKK